MNSSLDSKYITQTSHYLRNFRQKSPRLFNFSCPICGDSKTIKTKARGYLFEKKDSFFYRCHNCNASMRFSSLLKEISPELYKSYILESFTSVGKRGRFMDSVEIEHAPTPVKEEKTITGLPDGVIRFDTLSDEHYAKQYLKARKLDDENLKRLFFTEDFQVTVDEIFDNKYKGTFSPKEHRIIIPIYDQSKNLIGLQGRSINNASKKLRYITLRLDESKKMLFGIERCDFSKKVYVVEGPLDSLFLPNAIAVLSSSLYSIDSTINLKDVDCTFVYDNEPRNAEIVKNMEETIRRGYKVCIWNSSNRFKDVNDMFINNHFSSVDDAREEIDGNTWTGIGAKLKLSKWRKC